MRVFYSRLKAFHVVHLPSTGGGHIRTGTDHCSAGKGRWQEDGYRRPYDLIEHLQLDHHRV